MDTNLDIAANLRTYLGAREPTARYTSFDYCFNFFQSHRLSRTLPQLLEGENLMVACLQLGFYLASWGMLRGSADLLRRSAKHLVPVIEAIVSSNPSLWEIDVNSYGDTAYTVIFEGANRIRASFPEGASDILVSKIMLGTYGCVPAFDTYFKKGFGVTTFGPKALRKVSGFYRENASIIDSHCVATIDFHSGRETQFKYTRAKVVDMIFFVEGGS